MILGSCSQLKCSREFERSVQVKTESWAKRLTSIFNIEIVGELLPLVDKKINHLYFSNRVGKEEKKSRKEDFKLLNFCVAMKGAGKEKRRPSLQKKVFMFDQSYSQFSWKELEEKMLTYFFN